MIRMTAGLALALEWICVLISAIILVIRLCVRANVPHVGIQWEDLVLIFSQFLFFGWVSMDTSVSRLGFMDDDRTYETNLSRNLPGTDDEKVMILKIVYASAIPYYFSIWCIKWALLGLYYRLVPRGTKTRIALHITAVVTVCGTFTIVLVNALNCQPVSLNWSLSSKNYCYSSTSIVPFAISSLLNIFVDVAIFVLPFPAIRSLKSLDRRTKSGLIITFSVGFLTIAVAIVRLVLIALTVKITVVAVLTAVENATSMAVTCLPSMRPLIRKFKKLKQFSFSNRAREKESSDYLTARPGLMRTESLDLEVDAAHENRRVTRMNSQKKRTYSTDEELDFQFASALDNSSISKEVIPLEPLTMTSDSSTDVSQYGTSAKK